MVATYDDAALVVQLVRWGTELGLSDAVHTLLSEGFDPSLASTNDVAVRKCSNSEKWLELWSSRTSSTRTWCSTCGGPPGYGSA